ncbi:MAG TPA: 2Fe-2S iron-sulfur cluster binding domain-containing protein [Spirochaetales bacterium]|nr:2Fe-2S iron-sulfur cluster binding domain-containing protein [Spirochaetales bacterium]HPD80582.1 2Fe-2S iron-sulfur cluster binding domain-containing protein [Spirochaetales bacterium]HQG40011.1 2Fe-2S iron-sulfur cluster binding domain-containing protein [Spirochaetales bacterium]HQK35328.1 2Fe-2S iron-sulfur cluster binding domain-containing protein [Spirochaetales bacterium]HRV29291.1 2Fe-2S iron-sulfur cluster binding domain-containing protein [Spirochaetia bacterium]
MNSFLIGPAVSAAITMVLALLITIIDKLVNNYGVVTIDINNGKKKLEVKGGSPLLLTLAGQGIFVPSACGGRGSCGACKVKVISDVGPHLPTELPYLSPDEVKQNVRLSCQIKVKKNIDIELPEVLFNVKKYKARVVSMRNVTYDIKEVLFELGNDVIQFAAGQYVQLVVPPYDKVKESVQRAYSMSSIPSDTRHVELLIRLVPGGIATTWVHTKLAVGMTVELIGPFGEFHVHDTPKTMICVAGGSGMAPFKSMLYDIAERNLYPDKEIWYFFGARTKKDMFYLDEMDALQKKLSRFHFVPALSEPQPDDKWQGETGIITDVLDRYIKEHIGKDNGLEGYLCGSPGMINACIKVMTAHGIRENEIYFDKFA